MLNCFKHTSNLYKTGIIIFLLMTFFTTSAQNFIIHTVAEGEKLSDIAKIYQVAPSDILKYNAGLDAGKPLKAGKSILIPKTETALQPGDSIKLAQNPIDYKYHTVGENETLFSLSKQYHSKIEDIVKLNNVEGYDIKLGQILIIPIFPDANAPKAIDTLKYTYYEVQPHEGEWRIAYNHGITMDELERLNPEIKNETIKPGQKLIVPKFITSEEPKRDLAHFIYHEVKPKETLYSLHKKYNISIEDIKSVNPDLVDGLKYGQTIKIPKDKLSEELLANEVQDFNEKIDSFKPKDSMVDTRLTLNKIPQSINLLDSMRLDKTYRIAIMLPFKLKSLTDNNSDLCQKLMRHRILDYYSGIKLAIDSLRQLGLNVQYDVFDTQASPYVTGKILETTDLSDYDFVIGPVKKDNIEKVAHILEYDNTPVAVHNYKGNQVFRNLIVTTSNNTDLQNHMLQYIKEQSAGKKLSIIYDPTQKAEADSLAVKLGIPVTKIGGKEMKKGLTINADNIKKALDRNKENAVILLSKDDSFIFTVLSTLNSLKKNYYISLYTLEDKKLYEDDKNDRMNEFLANLNYHFPAKMIRKVAPELAEKFKKQYNTLPDFTAINGFDTTFDLLVRAANADNLFEGLQKIGRTTQTSKVYLYQHTPDTGFKNQGSIILEIDKDLNLHKIE